jgi:hypothetical protein
MKRWLAVALSSLVFVSNPFSPAHLLQENEPPLPRPASAGETCDPGLGHGLNPDHSIEAEPFHVCVLCKNFNGMLEVGFGVLPLFTSAATDAVSQSRKLHFPGSLRVSRSPPALS